MKRRKLRSFGIFSPKVVGGGLLSDPDLRCIYDALKQFGFKETGWQYVFKGQLAGLVYPYRCENDEGVSAGENEVHIRFYQDHVFSEYEIGRAYLTHFLGPRYNANDYVMRILKDILGDDAMKRVCHLFSEKNQFSDESQMPKWDYLAGGDLFRSEKYVERGALAAIAIFGVVNSGWKAVAYAFLFAVSAVAVTNGVSYLFFLWLLFPLIKHLPSLGNP